ncbi:acetyltransferase [Gottschalkia purinilytica]|uniref:Acetyltransferase n=1 Tax=Gottschalkia purinilytica TaxID=1503 RepID=A0A0L0WDM2_GOTPU|nr:GNAT family N-acetyltransferase [Gottschalkia purinilytica]KNF09578.1 acetyltransferase [Gottschalkia purinilytica]
MKIRRAKQEDHIYSSELILNAIEGLGKTFTGYNEKRDIVDTLSKFFQMDECRFSYKNTIVYEEDKKVVGVILGYCSNDTDKLDEAIIKHLREMGIKRGAFDKESFENEYYIDTVSVDPQYQGRGIAKKLFKSIEDEARKLGHDVTSLIVDIDKENAYRLYQKLGYEEDQKMEVDGHLYRHMIKKL